MEKLLLRSNDKEHMKLAMLKHEETFKEQVYELHRLYRIQKTLMKSFQGGRNDAINFTGFKEDLETEDEAAIELTLGLGPTGYAARSRKRCETRRPTCDTSPSFSSSSTTVSSGQDKSGTSSGSDAMIDGKEGDADGGADNTEDGRNAERLVKHPPWLFQALLSLN